jgi:hypothetical protein
MSKKILCRLKYRELNIIDINLPAPPVKDQFLFVRSTDTIYHVLDVCIAHDNIEDVTLYIVFVNNVQYIEAYGPYSASLRVGPDGLGFK